MHILFISLALILSLLVSPSVTLAASQVGVGATFGEEGLQTFYFSIGEYFGVPEKEVIVVKERHIPEEEIPVVFFIARRARVAPAAIIDLRLRKRSWMDIVVHYGLSPEIFYVPVRMEVKGPPYGRAYGYYKKPKHEWKKIVFKDDDVVNLVNLKFMSEHYKYSPDEVIKIRSKGKNFVMVHDEIKRGKKEKEDKGARGEKEGKHDGRGKGKGKGRGK